MAINFSAIDFGHTLYYVNTEYNYTSRKKITTVINGVEWYRYDKPRIAYSLVEYTYAGRCESVTYGDVDGDEVADTKYFVKKLTGEMDYLLDRDADDNDWFDSKEKAKAEVKKRQNEQLEIDRR
jgi:hypothetical protein